MHYLLFFRSPPGAAHHVCSSVLSAVQMLSSPPFTDTVEGIFVVGGTEVYRVTGCTAMLRKSLFPLYLSVNEFSAEH